MTTRSAVLLLFVYLGATALLAVGLLVLVRGDDWLGLALAAAGAAALRAVALGSRAVVRGAG